MHQVHAERDARETSGGPREDRRRLDTPLPQADGEEQRDDPEADPEHRAGVGDQPGGRRPPPVLDGVGGHAAREQGEAVAAAQPAGADQVRGDAGDEEVPAVEPESVDHRVVEPARGLGQGPLRQRHQHSGSQQHPQAPAVPETRAAQPRRQRERRELQRQCPVGAVDVVPVVVAVPGLEHREVGDQVADARPVDARGGEPVQRERRGERAGHEPGQQPGDPREPPPDGGARRVGERARRRGARRAPAAGSPRSGGRGPRPARPGSRPLRRRWPRPGPAPAVGSRPARPPRRRRGRPARRR